MDLERYEQCLVGNYVLSGRLNKLRQLTKLEKYWYHMYSTVYCSASHFCDTFLQVKSKNKQNLDECVIQCEMSRIAACSGDRVKRARDKRTGALSQQIAGIFHAAIRKSKYPGSQIDIYVQVKLSNY